MPDLDDEENLIKTLSDLSKVLPPCVSLESALKMKMKDFIVMIGIPNGITFKKKPVSTHRQG